MMDRPHTVKSFDESLDDLDRGIERMGMLAVGALVEAFAALETANAERARKVIDGDKKIDEIEREIDGSALSLIALRQPLAADLRHVAAVMKISSDIERIGDLAKNVAKRSLEISESSLQMSKLPTSLHPLVESAQAQVRDVLTAFSKRDAVLAEAVWRRDAELDVQHQTLFRSLLTFMMEDPRNIGPCAHLLFVAKNLERIGDHATNIAEKVMLMVSGGEPVEERPRGAA
jgi:phosphate transport system protein